MYQFVYLQTIITWRSIYIMDQSTLLRQIGNLIEEKLQPIKEKLDTLELNVEGVNKKVDQVEHMVNQIETKIDESQKDTIEVLSELIHTGYNLHEKRIKDIEDAQKSSHAQ